MPVDLDNSMSLRALVLEVAERTGRADYVRADLADNTAGVPIDNHDLDFLVRAVNRGYDQFLRSDPEWSFAMVEYQITMNPNGTDASNVDGEGWRNRLPSYISSAPKTPWRYLDSVSVYGEIRLRPYDEINRLVNQDTSTGVPRLCAIHPVRDELKPSIDGEPRFWEVVWWPRPGSAYVVSAEFRIRSHKLRALEDRHIAGRDHDHAILDQAVWWVKQHDSMDPGEIALAGQTAALSLGQSKDIDHRMRSVSRPVIIDPNRYIPDPRYYVRRPRTTVDGVTPP